jgi:hypothetical protein
MLPPETEIVAAPSGNPWRLRNTKASERNATPFRRL